MLAIAAPSLEAVEQNRFSGILAGKVLSTAGKPQMGAAVLLYNRFDRLVARLMTDSDGSFLFDELSPDSYSIRVNLASFVPAVRRGIMVQPGMRSFLSISLSSVLSSVELVYFRPGRSPVMSDDWKWVLRGAQATRPVLRFLPGYPGVDISDPNRPQRGRFDNMFSDTRGLVRLTSGESGILAHAGSQADLGTAFALATTVLGTNQVQVSGNFGYASNSGIPTAGFRTSISREGLGGTAPVVNVTMRQVFLPRAGAVLGRQGNLPALQTMTVSFQEKRQLADELEIHYGSSLESVSFIDRLNYVSPFARIRWGTAEGGAIEFAYSSGAPATDLLAEGSSAGSELNHQLNTLSLFPRISLRGGRVHAQRSENFEIGYRQEVAGRIVALSAYRESISNTALMMSADGAVPGMELVPDLASNSSIYNAGRFRRMGYTAAFTQKFGEDLSATLGYGYGGAIQAPEGVLGEVEARQIRNALRRAWRHSVTARVSGKAPYTGTKYAASYQATDYSVLQTVHLSLTQRSTMEPGLNLYLRQPIPMSVKGGRLEASAELRNLLAQGYLPVSTSSTKVLLIQSPRAVRGGVSIIF